MKCRKCVRNIESDSRFCRHCGTKVVRVIGAGVNADMVAATSRGLAGIFRRDAAKVERRRTADRRKPAHAAAGIGPTVRYTQPTLEFPETHAARAALDGPPAPGASSLAGTTPVPADASQPQATTPGGDVYRDPQFEQHIWSGRPAWRAGTSSWILWFLLSGVSLYLSSNYSQADASLTQVVWIFVVGGAVTLLARWAVVVFGFSYQLTTQRLFVHRGILTRVTDQLELIRIDDVRLVQSITDRIVNTGNVDIFSSDETDENVMLRAISAPVEVAEAIRLHVRGARSKGTLSIERI